VKWYCAVTAGGKIQVSANLAEIGDGPLAVDLMLGEAAEQLECEVLVEVITQRQRRNDLGADIGIGAGDREAAPGDRRIGVGIDYGGQHPHLDIAVVASGRGGERPANHAKSQRLKRVACQSCHLKSPCPTALSALAIGSALILGTRRRLLKAHVPRLLLTGVRLARIWRRVLRLRHEFS
jgi:hypothetical protein